ncbi:MAG: sensor histidine kinase [Caloramator sp.]|jgi:PAS domain S-box-containing protein|uniref:PAS domain-containing sensor histidine kinase n=1 Tax=Caloramator sp. TaxID=1871330 RepID=UPI001D4BE973|nr:ATP-binding protein [Caloramator sp.]MBZ4662648.1 sensor histidine kinase [Caloramator sp.]
MQNLINEKSLYMLENMPVLIDALDENGNIIFWNKEAERVTGYSKEEIINNPDAFKLLYPDDTYRSYILSLVPELENNFRNLETTITCKDGSQKVISWSNVSSLYPIEGLSLWAVGVDITKRKMAEENLKNITTELLSIVKAFPDLYFKIDKDTTILDFRTYNRDDLYVSPDKIIGNKIIDMLPMDVALLYKSAIDYTLSTKKIKSIEYSLSFDSSKQYFEARIVALKENQVIAVVRNITEKKLIEIKNLEQQKKYKSFFDYSPDMLLEADLYSGYIFVANPTFFNITKLDKNDLEEFTIYDLFNIENQITSKEAIDALLKGEPIKFETKLVNKVNEEYFLELNIMPILDNTLLDRIFIYAKDITDSKKLEESRRKIKELEEYENIRSEFFANISHEFRTPLNIILGSIQLLELYLKNNKIIDDNDTLYKYNKSIKQNCFRLLRLVNNLIDITKVNAGYMQLNLCECNIVSLIEDIIQSVADYINSKNIEIIFDTEIEEKYIKCDKDKIERIILNLLSNAIKFTPNNGKIIVNIKDLEEYTCISVKDTGIGIPYDKQDIIFERFSQVNKSLSREREGSGLGLNIVKSFIEMHGGEIKLISEEGKGSEFIILLPNNLDKEVNCEIGTISNFNNVERISIEFSDIYF